MKKYRIKQKYSESYGQTVYIIEELCYGMFWQGVGGDYAVWSYKTFEEAEAKVMEFRGHDTLKSKSKEIIVKEYL